MKRLLFTVTNDLNFDQRMIRICSTLAKAGYEVTLIGRNRKTSQPTRNQPFMQIRLSLLFEKGALFYAEMNIRLFFFLLFKKADLICAIDLDTLPAGFLAARFSGKKIIYDAHEYFTEVPELVTRPVVQKIWKWLARFFIPKVDDAYTVAPKLAAIFERKFGIPFAVIRNMPTTTRQPIAGKNKDKSAFTLLYQGALNDGRGLEQIITAMSQLRGCQFYLAGEGDLSQPLRALAKEIGVENQVHFLGWLFPEQLKELTLRADLGLNLLQNKGLNYYYSLANKAFDYVQAEVPAIHMQFPEYQALNEEYETSLLIPDLQINTILDAILKLKTNPKLYEKLKSNCHLAKQKWNWEKESEKLIRFYKKNIES